MVTKLIRLIDDLDKFVTAQRPLSDIKPLVALLREQAEAVKQAYAIAPAEAFSKDRVELPNNQRCVEAKPPNLPDLLASNDVDQPFAGDQEVSAR